MIGLDRAGDAARARQCRHTSFIIAVLVMSVALAAIAMIDVPAQISSACSG